MKFYLINPKLPLSFTGGEYVAPMMFRKYSTPPLGLLTVAAMIPERHHVSFCDENVSPINWDEDCDVVGLTGMHLQGPGIHRIASRFRERGKTIVLGGPSVMAVPERYREVVDVMMLGEAEQIFPRCIEDLEQGTVRDAYRPDETVDLRTSPLPRFELVSPKQYMSVSLQTTRGCPFKCEFCDIITLYGRKVRTKPVPQVLGEVQRLVDLGWDRFFFVDDNFIGDPRYTAELLEALIDLRQRLKRRFVFSTQATINLAHNQRLLQMLHDGGCRSVFIGIETPRVSSLQETQKFQNVRKDTLADIERIQSQGITVHSGLIVGFDNDDASIFREQIDFFTDAKIALPLPSILRALPATPLYNRMRDEGRLIPGNDLNSYVANIVPKQFTVDELERGYQEMIGELYEPVRYSDRVLGELANLNKATSKSSNYPLPVVAAAFLWVLLWFIVDPNRRTLLRAFLHVVPTALLRYPGVADAALQRIVVYRQVRRFITLVAERQAAKTPPRAAERLTNLHVPA